MELMSQIFVISVREAPFWNVLVLNRHCTIFLPESDHRLPFKISEKIFGLEFMFSFTFFTYLWFPSYLRCFGDELNRYSKTAHADIWAHDDLKQIYYIFQILGGIQIICSAENWQINTTHKYSEKLMKREGAKKEHFLASDQHW